MIEFLMALYGAYNKYTTTANMTFVIGIFKIENGTFLLIFAVNVSNTIRKQSSSSSLEYILVVYLIVYLIGLPLECSLSILKLQIIFNELT